ncbi:MAG TPA: hypothetical protein VFM70_00065 [Salinimicrobium sp.]|nr:hypothetical protein [Salinimicrobium sp.]
MKPLIKCEIQYFPSPHLSQLYVGFETLRKNGVIDLVIKPFSGDPFKPLLHVKVNDKYNVIYDTLDGFFWIHDLEKPNLQHFKEQIKADYYFKRSFNQKIKDFAPENCEVHPLGFNYPMSANFDSTNLSIKDRLKNTYVYKKYLTNTFNPNDFEYYPVPNNKTRIVFITRLWDPKTASLSHLQDRWKKMNEKRMNVAKSLKKEFGSIATVGVQKSNYSSQVCDKDLLLDSEFSKRKNFLKLIKQSNICVATNGLHNSIGWKFGEYIAASRAIVSEELVYETTGDFENEKNYLAFTNEEELINNISFLCKDKNALQRMMRHNYSYYHNFLRPDILILNTLLKITEREL